MRKFRTAKRGIPRLAATIAWLAVGLGPAETVVAQADEAYVILARHAEKLEGDDPGLTSAGVERARSLEHALSPWRIEAVYVSQFRRTRDTGAPLAEASGLESSVVDAGDVAGLAEKILAERRGAVVVVGHSNTVPALIRALGVETAPSIPEDRYDDLFVVRLEPDGGARLLHFKYGAPSPG